MGSEKIMANRFSCFRLHERFPAHTHTHTQNGLSIPNEKKRRRKLFVAEKTTLVIISAQFHFLYVVVVVRRWASSADGGGRGNDGDCKIQKCPPGFYSSNWNEIQHTYTHRTSTPPSTLHLPSLHCLVGLVRDGMWITCSLCDHISFQHTMHSSSLISTIISPKLKIIRTMNAPQRAVTLAPHHLFVFSFPVEIHKI